MSAATRPRLVVLSGPSGVGKTTVANHLLEGARFERVITATTRRPRPGEVHGRDYLFVDRAGFQAWIDAGSFLEWAEVYGERYGSPRAQAEAILARGRHALLVIDVQGAASVRAASPGAFLVFLVPPTFAELERRIRSRATETPEATARRLATARSELARQHEFDLVVVSDVSARAAEEIASRLAAPPPPP